MERHKPLSPPPHLSLSPAALSPDHFQLFPTCLLKLEVRWNDSKARPVFPQNPPALGCILFNFLGHVTTGAWGVGGVISVREIEAAEFGECDSTKMRGVEPSTVRAQGCTNEQTQPGFSQSSSSQARL